MPELKTYDLFISHAWNYNENYYRLEKFLNEAPYFYWRNYSVPIHDPVLDPNSDAGKQRLAMALNNQIKPVNCVLVISGMYVAYKYWIQKEIEIAQSYMKPIIGIMPWGQERIPLDIQDAAIELVGWNTSSIVSAIRKYSI